MDAAVPLEAFEAERVMWFALEGEYDPFRLPLDEFRARGLFLGQPLLRLGPGRFESGPDVPRVGRLISSGEAE